MNEYLAIVSNEHCQSASNNNNDNNNNSVHLYCATFPTIGKLWAHYNNRNVTVTHRKEKTKKNNNTNLHTVTSKKEGLEW